MAEIIHWYLHVDLDAFFASVEQLDNPEYRGKPVIVGGKPEDRRSVVSTASYEARKFGVHSAMPTFQAYKLCPQGIFVHGRMHRYAELSFQIMNIFREYSPDVDQMSIDEAFIDITGTEKLFGPPEETAKKIKEHVKRQTGLTVSVGLATTKYIAKIASGYNKPDGFTFVHKGDEEKFMLALPLTKVWGLGAKSLELVRSKGINSTREIYERSFDTLEFLFGKNMATFLYNVVRGIDNNSFGKQAKSHSISAERTFSYDLTDTYIIETEILELAQGVFFRLLKEEGYSRTAMLKIRFEDFSTCTVQETIERNIITIDSFYEILKRLFEKRYEKGRGIRLLGVGFENIEKEDKPYQQDLFSDGSEKKQAVEKAILTLEKKHPEIKVRKARTFKSLLILTLLSLIPYKTYAVSEKGAAASLPDTIEEPQPSGNALFNWSINDSNNVEFDLSGFWKAEFTGSLISSFGNGHDFSVSTGIPIFKQEVDLSTWVLLNKHWFFESNFADNFKKNTLAIGYKDGSIVKSARLSNRNITFPSTYSSEFLGYSISGGENQSPGFSAHLESPINKWNADFLIRYDMTAPHSKTFFGLNSVTDIKSSISNFLYGKSYHFPESSQIELSSIKDIYVESKNGTYTDSFGKKYKKLSITDYTYLSSRNELLLSKNANAGKNNDFIPTVLITFISDSSVNSIISKTGSYSAPESFAGKIQEQFNQAEKKYNLEDFSYTKTAAIEGKQALVIQSSYGFCPYVSLNIYDCGLSQNADLSVINSSSDQPSKTYIAAQLEESYTQLQEDFFNEKHLYAKIINQDNTDSLYPFAQDVPEIYLNLTNYSDFQLLTRNYSPVKELEIGTQVAAGTVQVYKNGILDNSAIYNKDNGTVTLSSSVSQTDKIYILWQEDSNNFANGTFTAGTGYKYNFNSNFSGDISLTAHWPLTFNNPYSTVDNIQRGFAALSAGINYEKDDFSISDKTAVALSKENATDKLLVAYQKENTDQTYYLDSNAGYPVNANPIITNNPSQIHLLQENNYTINNFNGIKDSAISGYAIPLSWDFSNTNIINSDLWAGVDIKLNSGYLLKDSSELQLALYADLDSGTNPSDYSVYIQLGINADSKYYGEDSASIPTYKIDNLLDKQWQTVSIQLSDSDRAKFVSNHDLRLIVIPENTLSLSQSKGSIYIGPYEPVIQNIYTQCSEDIITTSNSYTYDTDKYSTAINWTIPSTVNISSLPATYDTYIYTKKYFSAADFSEYESINLDFSVNGFEEVEMTKPSEPQFIFQLTDGSNNPQYAVKVEIKDITPYFSNTHEYHTLSVSLGDNKVSIDDNLLNSADYNLYINKSIVPTCQIICINTHHENIIYKQGTLHIGDLYYSDSKLKVGGKNYINAKYKFTNGSAEVSSLQAIGDFTKNDYIIESSAKADYKIAGIKLNTDISFNKTLLSNAGHGIKTEKPLFKFLNLEENYRISSTDKSLSKYDSVSFDFNSFKVPVNLNFSTQAQEQFYIRNQNTTSQIKYNYTLKDYSFGIDLKYNSNQKINTLKNTNNSYNTNNYFIGWYDISTLEFSTGDENALLRNNTLTGILSGSIPQSKFKPSLTYRLASTYNNTSDSTFTDLSTLSLSLPFTFSKNSLTFNISRNGGFTENISFGGNYYSDLEKLFELQNNRGWFYSSIPIYELFDKTLIKNITGNYSSKYEVTYKRTLFNNIKDVFVPSAASFAVIRDIKPFETVQDIYQYKTVLTNTSVNNFGTNSKLKLFDWFKQEEIISSITGIFKVPTDIPQNFTYQITSYLQINFMIAEKQILSTAFDCSFETNKNWSTHATFIYNRPSDTSLAVSLLNWIAPKTKEINFIISRKEILNFELIDSENILQQNYTYSHLVDMNFMKNYTLSNGFGLTYSHTQDSVHNLGINFTIGAKMQF